MHPVCKRVFKEKKQLLDDGNISELERTTAGGKDLATLLITANAAAEEEDRMPDDVVVANMSSIVLGGQETTSGALSRLLCLMVNDPKMQARLRQEILDARTVSNLYTPLLWPSILLNYLNWQAKGEELDYQELNNLPYLDGVCREALRLFAPVTFVWRQ